MQVVKFTVWHLVFRGSESEGHIRELCEKRKGITDYALILHDRGESSPHWHLLLRGENKIALSTLHRNFGIEESRIERWNIGGVKGFNSGLLYLLHISEDCKRKGKIVYSPEEVISNIDVKKRIKQILNKKDNKKYINSIREIAFNGSVKPEMLSKDYGVDIKHVPEIIKYYELGKKSRRESEEEGEIEKFRVNIYVFGEGGVGKTTLCDCIARGLYPNGGMREIVFNTSSQGNTLRKYSGQPVLIWDDIRPEGLIGDLGGRSNFLRVFRPNPRMETVNVKYGSVTLLNKYNLVNSYMSFGQFIGKISGDEDKNQYVRRFPIVIHILSEKVKIYYLKKFLDPKSDWSLNLFKELEINFTELAYNLTQEEIYCITREVLSPLIELIRRMEDTISNKSMVSQEEKETIFLKYGLKYSSFRSFSNERIEGIVDRRVS